MKTIYSILLLFIFTNWVVAQTNQLDFSTNKKVHNQAGAWNSEVTHMFFFEDGTALYISFGKTSVGYWEFTNKKETKIKYTWLLDNGPWTCVADILGDQLVRSLGDYENTYNRIQKRRMNGDPSLESEEIPALQRIDRNISHILSCASNSDYRDYLESETEKYIRRRKINEKWIEKEATATDSNEINESDSEKLERARLLIDSMLRDQIAQERLCEIRQRKDKNPNQQVDPIVKTPVDKVEAQGTQGHP